MYSLKFPSLVLLYILKRISLYIKRAKRDKEDNGYCYTQAKMSHLYAPTIKPLVQDDVIIARLPYFNQGRQ